MGLDMEHFRGRYFDIKDNQRRVEQDTIARNRYIRGLILAYERAYRQFEGRKDRG